MARPQGGFFTACSEPIMIGQIQAIGMKDPFGAKVEISIVASKK